MNEFPDISILEHASQSMPLFPLGRTVLLPHTVLPLHVFEPRYVQLIRHIEKGHQLFAIPRLKDPSLCTEEELQQESPAIVCGSKDPAVIGGEIKSRCVSLLRNSNTCFVTG